MRLDKAVTLKGLSRKSAKDAISAGRVTVNGSINGDPAYKLSPADSVTLDGAVIDLSLNRHIMLYKPEGVITATEDGRGEKTVLDILPNEFRFKGLGPVGRLDKDVTGLVILTTDGALAHRLISPKWEITKEYLATVEGRLMASDEIKFEQGIELNDFTAKPAKLKILGADDERSTALVYVSEGKFHQVKRMFKAVGHEVLSLKRLSIAGLALDGDLKEGESRLLTPDESALLYRSAHMEEG